MRAFGESDDDLFNSSIKGRYVQGFGYGGGSLAVALSESELFQGSLSNNEFFVFLTDYLFLHSS